MNTPNNSRPEEPESADAKVGQILQQARLAAHIEVNKLCTDLRISPQALEALEQGNYHLLPGDPYIRALLGSLSRYLGLDPQALVKGYNKEIGAVHPAPPVTPYKDKAHTYKTAHKQIFIIIVIALFAFLFILISKLNKGELSAAAGLSDPNPVPTNSLQAPIDSSPESRALMPDSAEMAARLADSLRADKVRADSLRNAAKSADSLPMHSAMIKPLVDSVWVKVLRSGKEDFVTLLRLGKQVQVTHQDTIVVIVGKKKSVEVTVGSETVIPDRKKFKIYGKTLKTF